MLLIFYFLPFILIKRSYKKAGINYMNQDNKILNMFSRIIDLILLNFLFLLTSIPIFTLGASMTALFSVSLKMVRNEESYIARNYFHAFKKNFKQATLAFLGFAMILLLFSGNIIISYKQYGRFFIVLRMVSLLFILFVGIYFLYFFPVLARFYFTTKQILLHIPHMILTHLSAFVSLIVIMVPIIFLCVYSLYTAIFILIFGCVCGFALYAYVTSFLFRKVFEDYELPADR